MSWKSMDLRLLLHMKYVHINWTWCKNMRAAGKEAYIPTDIEHLANILTHGVWVVPSIIQSFILMQYATSYDQHYCALVYGIALSTLFMVSTTFHFVSFAHSKLHPELGSWKNILHISDRAAIYLFIAGSYTPWLTLKSMGFWGCQMRWLVWLLSLCGILYQYMFHEQFKILEIIFYVFIGIFPSMAIFSMYELTGIKELAISGAIYLTGVIFFKCDGRIPCAHAIWHLFVVVAATYQHYLVCNILLAPPITSHVSI